MDNLQDFYIKCIKDLKQKETYFNFELVKITPMKLECTESAYTWIVNYKTNIITEAKILFKEFEGQINFKRFLVLYYFCFWIVKDILELLPYLPNQIRSSLNIGAGMGFLDIFLYQLYKKNLNISCVELKSMEKIEHYKKISENLSNTLNISELLNNNIILNNVNNFKIYESDSVKKIQDNNEIFDFIISIRSWCFLYDIKFYSELVRTRLSTNGSLICDVSPDRFNEFSNIFNIIHVIKSYKLFNRVLAVPKI